MKTFEYTILEVPVTGWLWGGRIDTEALLHKLNELGKGGWHVVTANDTNRYHGGSRNMFVILQREIQ